MAKDWGFRPDKGKAFFISYNSLDWDRVAPIAKALHDMGYPVWYDSGLEAGSSTWREQISASITRCHALIVFVTKGIFDREKSFVLNEYDQAAGLNKPVIPVFLDEVDVPKVPVKYRWYASEWSKLRGVAYRDEPEDATAERIVVRIRRDPGVKYKFGWIRGVVRFAAACAVIAALIIAGNAVFRANLPRMSDSLEANYPGSVEWMKEHLPEYTDWLPYPTGYDTNADNDFDFTDFDPVESGSDSPSFYENNVASSFRYVYLGSYIQNGTEPDPIRWRVLKDEGDRMLVVSQYLLDVHPYNDTETDTTWAECSLREWLNGEFLDTAFTPEEKERIMHSRVETPGNEQYGTSGGEATEDLLFCLSYDEAKMYKLNPMERNGAPMTKYAVAAAGNIKYARGCWWLRDPGKKQSCAACANYYARTVDENPGVGNAVYNTEKSYFPRSGAPVNAQFGMVRPAMWIKSDSAVQTEENNQ